jgi:hypothetical protein
VLAPRAEGLLAIREVGVELDLESERDVLRDEARDVEVLVQAASGEAREPDLDAVLRRLDDGVGFAPPPRGVLRRRQVVPHPRMLGDVRSGERVGRPAVDEEAITGQDPRLVDEKPAVGAAVDEAVSIGG